ncbi:mucosal addressin cell adhesion molecule 1 [Pelodiscus sinensis]|uniref:mucosal addressin cell adhesion molecule 1 n=1 Tax=Pelodiscus sinensis TaxID=13735 RepID=UPI003F6C2DBF
MEPASLLLLLSLGWTCRGQLTVLPQEPLVEVGGSIQLNCSLDCPNGKVQWKGLDTSLGNILSTPSYSLLSVTHATVAMEGTWICIGHCQGSSFQEQVDLQVYALPDTLQLETQPRALVAGQPAHLRCSISKVYPPSSLTLSWYQGDQRLHGTEAEEESDEEELFSYHSELEVPGEKVTEGSAFRCEVALLPPGAERPFQRVRAVTVSTEAVAEEPTTESVPGQENPGTESLATTENPIAGLVATAGNPTTDWTSAESPSAELTVTSHKPSLKATPDHRLETTETLATESSTAPQRPSATPWSRRSDTSSAPASPTAGVATTGSPWPEQTTGGRSPGTASVCSLRIRPDPPEGTTGEALKITCEAECGEGVAVRWQETPVALSQYQEEASEGKSTLTVDHVDLTYQGVYKCIVPSRSLQLASLHITVSAATFGTDSAIVVGTAGSLLGLIVTAFASRRLWRRLHPCHTQEC